MCVCVCVRVSVCVRACVCAEEEKMVVVDAMRHWEEHTCIRFHRRTNQQSYINFFQGSGLGKLANGYMQTEATCASCLE